MSHASTEGRLHCLVVTPERIVLDDWADFVAIPVFDGELGVLPGRAPLIARLGAGELRTEKAGATARTFIDGGFVQIRENVITVLTQHALARDEVSREMADHELVLARRTRASTDDEFDAKQRAEDRARAMARIATRN
jgi:F-type H+-transporting ATPase subunit epsilon